MERGNSNLDRHTDILVCNREVQNMKEIKRQEIEGTDDGINLILLVVGIAVVLLVYWTIFRWLIKKAK